MTFVESDMCLYADEVEARYDEVILKMCFIFSRNISWKSDTISFNYQFLFSLVKRARTLARLASKIIRQNEIDGHFEIRMQYNGI